MYGRGVCQITGHMLTACVCLPGAAFSEDAMERRSSASQGYMEEDTDGSQMMCSSASRWLSIPHIRVVAVVQ